MDGTATGILDSLLQFRRPARVLSLTRGVTRLQYFLPSVAHRKAIRTVCNCMVRAHREETFYEITGFNAASFDGMEELMVWESSTDPQSVVSDILRTVVIRASEIPSDLNFDAEENGFCLLPWVHDQYFRQHLSQLFEVYLADSMSATVFGARVAIDLHTRVSVLFAQYHKRRSLSSFKPTS